MLKKDNQQRSVKTKNAKKYFIEIGKMYGNYKVLEELKLINKKSPNTYITKYKIVHIITKKERIVRSDYLILLENKYLLNTNQLGLRKYLYKTYITGAKNRNHIFDLDFELFNQLISKNCYYCNEAPKEASDHIIIKRGNTREPKICYNGIDRLDSCKGYTIDNVVSCCSVCNYMKNRLSQENFLNQINKIYSFCFNKRSTTIPKGSTLQTNGSGKRDLLTHNGEDEDIV